MIKPVNPLWRYKIPIGVLIVVLLTALLFAWHPWRTPSPCGRGLSQTGAPYVCVGLDLESTPMKKQDPLADLEQKVATVNSRIGSDEAFATIVLLETMTPDPTTDSGTLTSVRYAIEGAITAVDRADSDSGVAAGAMPKIKLLLANFGTRAQSWQQTVAAIKDAAHDQHIVAVAGIGQSLAGSRQAVAALSDAGFTTVGGDVTADNMNLDQGGARIRNFFRVSPTNSDEASAAAQYITQQKLAKTKILLVRDTTESDDYGQTLAKAFTARFSPTFTEDFRSPEEKLSGAGRDAYMVDQFGQMHSDLCADQPDLIYFAGRGRDLGSFLKALANGGKCPLVHMTVLTGDDASNLVGNRFELDNIDVLYTALAYPDEWPAPPPDSNGADMPSLEVYEFKNYEEFRTAFVREGFARNDLADGTAIMMHDAVLVAATATRNDDQAVPNFNTLASAMLHLRCTKTVPGASGYIALDAGTGNPVDKTLVIVQIDVDGIATKKTLEWPDGKQIDYLKQTC
ncbi:MAG: hypothetical protein QOE72_3993 [Chloroflexota bacterium]|jgi:ABC-type branched-subunit amino acid transport system substrate-binding protein|nr:hypothetical protein [Chloroflexota bacterium]